MPLKRLMDSHNCEPAAKCMKLNTTHPAPSFNTRPVDDVKSLMTVLPLDKFDHLPQEADTSDSVIKVRTVQLQTSEELLNTKLSRAEKLNKIYTENLIELENKIKDMELKFSESLLKLKSYEGNKHHQIVRKMLKENKTDDSSAIFLLDQIKNYEKEIPVWSLCTVKMCSDWLASCPESYNFARKFMTLPEETSLTDNKEIIDAKDLDESCSVQCTNDSAPLSNQGNRE